MDVRSLAAAVLRRGAGRLLGTRRWTDARVAEIATDFGGTVLEIGSGRQDLGAEAYSVRRFFEPTVEFVQSDVNPAFGHRVVDVTAMDLDAEFDLVICLYVLEHVYDVPAAVANLHRALRPGGRLLVAVPHVYPYHDEPGDFWRFTEHAIRRLFEEFTDVEIHHRGVRRLPKGLYVIATR